MTLSDVDVLEPSILSCLNDNELFDTAVDALIEVSTCPDSYKYEIRLILLGCGCISTEFSTCRPYQFY